MDNIKYYSDMEKYEIINVNDGDKFNCLGNNDIVIDENGKFKLLILNSNPSRFDVFNKSEFIEVSWECVKKIGSKTIIIDAEHSEIKKRK